MKRRGIVEISPSVLLDILRREPAIADLGVDEDSQLLAVSFDIETGRVELLIEGAMMPKCPAGCRAVRMTPQLAAEVRRAL